MAKPWAVDADDAYKAWFQRRRPLEDEELALPSWLASLEDGGPPADTSADGENRSAEGPHGRSITFRVFETTQADTVAGYIYVLDID